MGVKGERSRLEEIGGREEENRLETGLVRDGEHSDGLRELLR